MMKKMKDKQMHRLAVGFLAVIAVLLLFKVVSQLNPSESQDDLLVQKDSEKVSVETITQEIKEKNIIVPEIKPIDTGSTKNDKDEQVVIEVPMPIEPEKPELEAPDNKPQTQDNLNDPDKVPTYNDKDLVKDGEKVIVVEEKKTAEAIKTNESLKNQEESKPTESKLVPASENPFANPANVGKPIELKGEDISDHVPGTGDKF